MAKEVDAMMSGFSPLARTAVAAYGGRAQQFFHQRMSFFRGDALAYYFDVNTKYALNKLRLLLCPFIHQGSWTRLRDQVEGRFAYKPPRHDVNAPDLYIPCTTMYLYVVACCGARWAGGDFAPMYFGARVWKALFAWALEIALFRGSLSLISTGQQGFQVPLLDLAAYGGYVFLHAAVQVLAAAAGGTWAYYATLAWGSLCMAVFLVKTLKRILFSQHQYSTFDMNKYNYVLLLIAAGQIPMLLLLGGV